MFCIVHHGGGFYCVCSGKEGLGYLMSPPLTPCFKGVTSRHQGEARATVYITLETNTPPSDEFSNLCFSTTGEGPKTQCDACVRSICKGPGLTFLAEKI